MSFTINTGKELAQARRPVLLADFTFSDGSVWRAASIDCTYGGNAYVPAIDPPEVERLQYLSEQGIDRVPSASVAIADPDGSIFTTYERGMDKGFKGATLLLRLVLRDVSTSEWSTDSLVPFIGTCDQPSVDAKGLKVSATNKLNLSQDHLPQTAISARCPWINPATTQQRTEAADSNSRFFRCGETRSLAAAPPCSYTRQTCTQPHRYGGSTWQPAKQGTGREYISGNRVAWTNPDTSGKYKQYWPQWLGGAAWVDVPVLNQWADANYTRGEAAIGIGQIDVLRVIVNGIELDQASSGDYRWHYVNNGARDGAHNTDTGYTDGDVYGNETVIQFLAPHSTIDPNSTATVRVLGRKHTASASISVVSAAATAGLIRVEFGRVMGTSDPGDGTLVTISGCSWDEVNGSFVLRYLDLPYDHAYLEGTYTTGSGTGGTLYYDSSTLGSGGSVPSPWVIQEALRASGRFTNPDFGTSWNGVAAIASDVVAYTDANGDPTSVMRFGSSVALKDPRSVADIVRGVRQSMAALLYFAQDGTLEIAVEGPLAEQQPSAVDGSNYNTAITSTLRDGSTASGYAAYHFDRSNSRNLQRTAQQNSTSPNKVSFTFLDPANDWAVSTFAEFDPEDVSRMEQETAGGLQVQPEGIASYNFAYRCARLGLNKVLRGNPAGDTRGTDWWQWEASFRGCKLRPGQIVLLTNARLGLDHQQVRIASIKPSANYETVTITGHYHSDAWYLDTPSTLADPERSYYHYTPVTPAPGAGPLAVIYPNTPGQVGVPYSMTPAVSGGTPPYSFALHTGSLSGTGLSLNAATGELSGTPTTAGFVSVTIRVTDAASATADFALSIAVASPSGNPIVVGTSTTLPRANDITALSVAPGLNNQTNFPYDKTTANGNHYASIGWLALSDAGCAGDPNAYRIIVTARDKDASGNYIGPEQTFWTSHVGAAAGSGNTYTFGPLDTAYGTDGYSYVRSGELYSVEFSVYVVNATDESPQAWSNTAASRLQNTIGVSGRVEVAVAKAVQDTAHGGKRAPLGTFDRVDRTNTGGGLQYDPHSGRLVSNNDNLAASLIQDPSFEFASPGYLGTSGIAPGWNWGIVPGSIIEIRNDGGNSASNYARLTGKDASLTQTITVQPGLTFYLSIAVRSSNSGAAGHAVGIYVNWLDANNAVLSPYTTIVGTVSGYVSAWTANAVSGYVTAPAGAAKAIIKISTSASEPALEYWDIDDVLMQAVIQQTANGQTTTTAPATYSGDYSALRTRSVTTLAESFYGKQVMFITGPAGENIILQVATPGVSFAMTDANGSGFGFGAVGSGNPYMQVNQAGVSKPAADNETITTSGGTRHVRSGLICLT